MANTDVTEDPGSRMRLVSVLDGMVFVGKHKRLIVRSVLSVGVVTAFLLFVVFSRWYKSTAVVMPPKQQNPLALLGAATKGASSLRNLALGGAGEELSKCQTILLSRTVLDSVIKRFSLDEVYGYTEAEKTRKELLENLHVGLGEEDVSIEISVYDTDKERAAAMANYFVHVLNVVYLDLSVTEARSNREFLEQRYRQNLAELAAAEDSLRVFQQTYGVYAVPEQLKASVEAAALLESKVIAKDVELGILRRSVTAENPRRQLVEVELEELKAQQRSMQNQSARKEGRSSILIPFGHAPEIGISYLRRFRELELQSKLLELILPMYEQARIEEQRNTPSVLVLDTAVPADRHTKPKRLAILAGAMIGAFILACGAAVFMEGMRRSRAEQGSVEEKISFIRQTFHWKSLLR